MNEYKCPNGHTFQSKAAIRAFCPECGESVKRSRISTPPVNDGDTKEPATNGNAEAEKPKPDEKPTEKPPEKKEPVRTKVIRVKRKAPDEEPVKKTKKEPKEETDDDKGRSKLIKRRRIRQKYRHPAVKGKVKTNKETQDEKLQGKQRLTHWEIFRKRAGFGG